MKISATKKPMSKYPYRNTGPIDLESKMTMSEHYLSCRGILFVHEIVSTSSKLAGE